MANLDVIVSAIDKTRVGLASAGRNIDSTENKTRKLGGAGKIAGLALGGLALAGVGAGIALVGSFLKTGDALDKMNKTTGIGIEDLQKYRFAAEQSGSSLEVFSKGILKQARFLDDANSGLATSTDALDALGLSVTDFEGLSPDEQFNLFATALSGIDDAGQKAALAQEVFGRAGAELLPLLSEGADGIAALTAEAEANGNIMSTDAAQAAAKFNDQLNTLKQKGLAVVQKAMAALIPAMLAVIDFIDKKVVPVIKEDLVPVFQEIGRVVKEVWEKVIGPIIEFAWKYVIKPIFKSYVIQAKLIIAGTKLIISVFQEIAEVVKEVWQNVIGPVISFVWNKILKPIFKLYIAQIKLVIKIFRLFAKVVKTVFDGVKTVIQNVWKVIKPIIERIAQAIKTATGAKDKVLGVANKVTGGLAGKVGGLLGFATGGTVPGPLGAPQLAVVHGGEQVLTPQQRSSQPMVAYLQIDGETLGRFVLEQTNNGIRRGELII